MYSHCKTYLSHYPFQRWLKLAGLFCALGVFALITSHARPSVGTASAKSLRADAEAFVPSAQASSEKSQAKEETLALRQPLERKLAGGEAYLFSLALKARQFARIVVTQQGIDVIVRLLDGSDKELAAVDSPNGNAGDEVLYWVAQSGGALRVEVRVLDAKASAGQYRIELVEVRGARAADKKRIAAQRRKSAGNQLLQQGSKETLRQAIAEYKAGLKLWMEVGERQQAAHSWVFAGMVLAELGEIQEALKCFTQALPLFHVVGDRSGEATTLNNTGVVYYELGEWQNALKYFVQALPQLRALGDRGGEATLLNNIGNVYLDLGEWQEALKYFSQALPLSRAVGDQHGEVKRLNNVGVVYLGLEDRKEALKYFAQALPLVRALGDRRSEATILGNLGIAHNGLGERPEALKYYNQALQLSRVLGDRIGEATHLDHIGDVYVDLGEQQGALKYYGQAIMLRRAVGDRSGEAITLNNLMFVWKSLRELRVAIYYGKQSVNRYQELRAAISGLDKEVQRTFLKSKEATYRTLADLLISLGRLPEAQQVLDLLKEEEYFSYVRRDGNEAAALKGRATLTPTEARLEKEYAEIADLVTTLGKELEELNRLTQPLPAQLARRTDVDGKLRLATERFQAFLGRLEKELGNSKDAGERLTQIQTSEGFQDTLRELGTGTVALYTVVGEKKYSVILTPGSGPQVAAETNITREELNKKIFALKDALRNPRVDPRPLAAELYNLLIAPMEKNLEGAKAETLMFSLDGALRYLPMAALYDAKRGQYLIERYRVVIYTPAGATDLKNPARANWRGLGFGVSKAVKNEEVGSFSALSGVPSELRGVIRSGQNAGGVMDGEVYLDEQFTEQRFSDSLRTHQFPLIHIASHFSFKPGDSLKSFLLLGDGNPLTMEKLRSIPNLFSGVDLLALSACETGVGEKDAEGKEVEGFAVLAQRKGAKAVLATLWPVADDSTAKLMQEFYRLRETQKGMNKAEALRQAQLSLLRGGLKGGKEAEKRSEVVGAVTQPQTTFKPDSNAPYAHPYYWAPFILIGNWK